MKTLPTRRKAPIPASTLRTRAAERAASERADPHTGPCLGMVVAPICLTLLWACGGSVSGKHAAGSASIEAKIEKLVELTTPMNPTLTSDVHDRQLHARRALVAELKLEDRDTGLAALAAYHVHSDPEEPVIMRVRLLEVAAHTAPDDTEPLLVQYITEYGHPIDIRTESVRLLAETRPERALEVLEPYVSRTRATETTPEDEFLVKGWVTACEATGRSPVPVLADVATNIYKQPYARYYCALELGKYDDPIGMKALEAILVESSGDGLLRRKAAQALRQALPAETACTIFRLTAEREADLGMLEFLGNMIGELCD